jgi:indole-3-glycerol phosphate synthase
MKGLEVLLEIHSIEEFLKAVESKADMIGINNRDLKTFKVDLDTTVRILSYNLSHSKVIVSESGIRNLEDIKYLQKHGVNAFLVGTSIMASNDIESKLKELTAAI